MIAREHRPPPHGWKLRPSSLPRSAPAPGATASDMPHAEPRLRTPKAKRAPPPAPMARGSPFGDAPTTPLHRRLPVLRPLLQAKSIQIQDPRSGSAECRPQRLPRERAQDKTTSEYVSPAAFDGGKPGGDRGSIDTCAPILITHPSLAPGIQDYRNPSPTPNLPRRRQCRI